jgi:putative tryptophan/tyrosine transport system substrate-binding protein
MLRREVITLLGGAAAWPMIARAQQPMPVIGFLSSQSRQFDDTLGVLVAFRQGLNDAGYIEGRNVAIEYRWGEGNYDRLPVLAAELVRREVTAIVAGGAPAAVAAKAATTSIPIVFDAGDPVELGLVASLNRPGGNATGISLMGVELAPKLIDLLHQLLPTASVIAVLTNPTNAHNDALIGRLQDAGRLLGLRLHFLQASNANEIDAAFETLIKVQAGGIFVMMDPFFLVQRDRIVALAAQHAVPAIYGWRGFVAAGGLMSYGADLADSFRQAGVYVGKILKGANPADLPVQQAVKLDLVINLKTAKTLGLTIPLTLAGRADEVIE